MSTRARKAPPLTEADFQRQVTDLAEVLGWGWAHFRPARTERGWRTPVSGPLGAGFPDLILVRDRLILAELKSDRGVLSEEQKTVRDALRDAGGEYYRWSPRDWAEVVEVLTRRAG